MTSTTNQNQFTKSTKSVNRIPSIPVRQTKTSKIRLERGNQCEYLKKNLEKLKAEASMSLTDITISKEGLKSDQFKKPTTANVLNRKSIVSRSSIIISRTNSGLKSTSTKSPTRNNNNKKTSIQLTQSESKIQKQKVSQINITQRDKVTINFNDKSSNKVQPSTTKNKNIPVNNKSTNVQKIETKPSIIKHPYPVLKSTLKTKKDTIKNEKKTVRLNSPLRKSISAMHLKRVSIRDPTAAIYRSYSAVNISQTINENETLQIPIFNTPMAKRRSIYNSTPMTISKNNVSPWSGCWSPTAQDLKRRLNIWMEKTGKPYNSFNTLRCFGMHYAPSQEENKENVEVKIPDKDSSYEDLKINVNDTCKSNIFIAYEALHDLHKLILEGYPVDQCEAWLDVIRTRFEEVEDKQEYWECMAAIDEVRGNMDVCYKNNENNEDNNLDNLLQKFNVLNLTPSNCAQSKKGKNKNLNNENIFKSTAINFAVKEDSKKNEEKKYFVTPVKRSNRLSIAGKLTPGIIVCSNLDKLDSSVRDSMHFRTNKALKK